MATNAPKIASLDHTKRGYHIAYRGPNTPCPGCGRSHWHVGRVSAECAFCTAAIPLEETQTGAGVFRVSRRRFNGATMGEAA